MSRPVKCSWKEMLRIRQMLADAERGDQARLEQMLGCVGASTVSKWKHACDVIEAIEPKVSISTLSGFHPSHATEIGRAFRAQHGKDVAQWPQEAKEALVEWVERVEDEKLTVSDLRAALGSNGNGTVQGDEGCTITDLSSLATEGRRFGCVMADPPWQYEMRPDDPTHRGRCPYPTMTVDEICALPVEPLAADASHLHLWTTNAFLPDSFRIIEAWGFVYKSVFVWTKQRIGLGHYWRVAHEFLLLGVRGSCQFRDHSLPSWARLEATTHSTKPAEVRGYVEKASPGPYLELFGRRRVKGWTVWGNEIRGDEFRQEAFA